MPTIEDFLRERTEEGTTTTKEGSRKGEHLITSFCGDRLEPPIRLRITEAGLHAVLEEMSELDLSDLWPDTDRHTAAYRLFLVHFHESIAMYDDKVELIEISLRRGRGTFEVTPRWDWDPADRGPHD